MSDLKLVLMKRDEITSDEADDLLNAAREQLFERIDQGEIEGAENICEQTPEPGPAFEQVGRWS